MLAEVFVVRLGGSGPELTGPCGPDAWYLEVRTDEDPVEVVARFSSRLMGPPLLVHSTSWRRHRGSVVLSFIVVLADDQATELASVPILRTELARSAATTPPERIARDQVIEHGLRHLAWLAHDDGAVRSALPTGWAGVLAGYVPEPFRHLRGTDGAQPRLR